MMMPADKIANGMVDKKRMTMTTNNVEGGAIIAVSKCQRRLKRKWKLQLLLTTLVALNF
jgi:hypothetical protein